MVVSIYTMPKKFKAEAVHIEERYKQRYEAGMQQLCTEQAFYNSLYVAELAQPVCFI